MQSKTKRFETILERFPSQGRFRFFLLFVLLSLSFWVSTKLSNTYQVKQDFSVVWSTTPKGIILNDDKAKINVSITASGIEILWYRLFKKTLQLELRESDFTTGMGLISIERQRFTIRQHLFDNTQLNVINTENIQLEFNRLAARKVKVFPKTSIKMRPGYLYDNEAISIPDSIWVRGSKAVLDTLNQIFTTSLELADAHQDFSEKVKLKPIQFLEYDMDSVQIEQKISRYSEKEFSLPVTLINLPKDIRVKLFPPNVTLKAILPLAIFNGIKASDFSLVVDYANISKNQSRELSLQLIKQPNQVKNVIWEPKSVNYLIRK